MMVFSSNCTGSIFKISDNTLMLAEGITFAPDRKLHILNLQGVSFFFLTENTLCRVKVQEEEDQHHQGGEGVADPETAAPPTEGEEAGNSGEENSPSWATIVAKYQ